MRHQPNTHLNNKVLFCLGLVWLPEHSKRFLRKKVTFLNTCLYNSPLWNSSKSPKIHVHTAIFKMENQQRPAGQNRELCSMFCGSLDGRGVWGRMDTCIWMAESLCCPPEVVTTLWISYCCCCSVTQSCLTLCDSIDWSMPSSLSLTTSRSLPKFMSIVSAMPSSHLILIFPSLRDFSNESAVRIRWPKYWSFNFSISRHTNSQEGQY